MVSRTSDGPACVACGRGVRATRSRPTRNEHVEPFLLDCTLTSSQYLEQFGGGSGVLVACVVCAHPLRRTSNHGPHAGHPARFVNEHVDPRLDHCALSPVEHREQLEGWLALQEVGD